VAAGVQDGKDRATDGAFQGAARQADIGFRVDDFGLDWAWPAKVDDFSGSQPSVCAAD
jgi:hypothetical protein